MPPPSNPPTGWYRGPYGCQRYFGGRAWTEHIATPIPAGRGPHRQLPIIVAFGAITILLASVFAGRVLLEHIVHLRWPIVVYVAINVIVGYGPSVRWCRYACPASSAECLPSRPSPRRVCCSAAHFDPDRGADNLGLMLILGAVGVILGGAAFLLRRIARTMLAHAILSAVVLTIVLLK